MEKREATRILRRMYKELRENPELRFRLRRGIEDPAWYEPEGSGGMVTLNPDSKVRGGIVALTLHELLHHLFDDKKETPILRMEKEMYAALSDVQLTNLMRRVFSDGWTEI
jgi:hypothetical protein